MSRYDAVWTAGGCGISNGSTERSHTCRQRPPRSASRAVGPLRHGAESPRLGYLGRVIPNHCNPAATQMAATGRYKTARRVGVIGEEALNHLASGDATAVDDSGPGGTRTHTLRIKSPLLYRWSYRPSCGQKLANSSLLSDLCTGILRACTPSSAPFTIVHGHQISVLLLSRAS